MSIQGVSGGEFTGKMDRIVALGIGSPVHMQMPATERSSTQARMGLCLFLGRA